MIKRQTYYIPDSEIKRDYRRKGDLACWEIMFECDFEDDTA